MSLLRTTAFSLGQGAKCLLQSLTVAERIPAARAAPNLRFQTRLLSSRRTTQPSRFQRSRTPATETPVKGVAREHIEPEPEPNAHIETEPAVAAPQPTPTQPLARPRYPPRHPHGQVPPEVRKPVDTSSKEYKRHERKVLSLIVALPFLFVTSYHLYDRRESSDCLAFGSVTDLDQVVNGNMPENSPFEPKRPVEPETSEPQASAPQS